MNTLKCGLRILMGVAVLYGAFSVHDKAHEISDEAIGVQKPVTPAPEPETPVRRQPFESDADFFGTDPRVEMKKPEAQAKLSRAIETDQLAICIALAGGALIVWGFYPVLRPMGLWLFMPDWVRRRMEAADKAEEHKESNHAGTHGTGTDGRGSGSDGIRDGEADRTVAEPPQAIARSEAAQRSDGPATHVVDGGRSYASP